MNYSDHNFIEITQQTKLHVEPVELDFVEWVDPLARKSRARRARCVEPCWSTMGNTSKRHGLDTL